MSWWTDWRLRHQHPISLLLHVVGIPLTIAAVILALRQLVAGRWDLWYRPVLLLSAGYILQWVGHLVEGNTMGEIILIRKLLGKPYVAVAPRYRDSAVLQSRIRPGLEFLSAFSALFQTSRIHSQE